MRFGVLGPLAAWTSSGELVAVPGAKVRTLLACLLVARGHPVSTDRLIDDLWGDDAPADAAGALQVRVSQLRRALNDAEPGARDLVRSRPPGYLLAADPETVDADRFAALAGRAEGAGDPRDRAALLAEALDLWRGEPYADVADEEFARAAVTRLNEQRLAVTERYAEARLALGEHTLLVGELADLVARHPLRERLRATYLRALYAAGRQSDALESYADLRRRLADELGLDPGPEIAALHRAILEQDPALARRSYRRPEPQPGPPHPEPASAAPRPEPASAPPHPEPASAPPHPEPASAPPHPEPASAPRPTGNLPAPMTELIGREDAVTELAGLLAEPGRAAGGDDDVPIGIAAGGRAGARLVTLTGPGGVGKTRLATETARRLAGAFPDGVWAVELATLDGSGSVADLIIGTLDVRDSTGPPVPAPERLVTALRPRRALLLLDNCEHVVEQVADLVDGLLRAAPQVRVLATSREPLGLAAESLWEVPPLAVPGPADDPEAVRRCSAAQLFTARVTARQRDFRLDERTAPQVAILCRRLDGIPLALELAATRVRALGVAGVVARLDDRFRLLATGHRDVPARQRTLTAVIDWSWDLLSEPDRAVLRRLAVHRDGCTLDAAEQVCAGDPVAPGDVLDALTRLVDRSLAVLDDTGDEPRYRLLESVSAYCLDRLDPAEAERAHERHVHYYTDLAVRAEPHLHGPEQRTWLRRLDAEAANLHAASTHAVGEPAVRLANALTWYRFLRGRLSEARRALARALAAGGGEGAADALAASGDALAAGGGEGAADALAARGDEEAAGARLRAAAWEAGLALMQGDDVDHDRVLRAYADAGDHQGLARARWFVGAALIGRGDPAGPDLVDRALAEAEATGDRWCRAAALSSRAMLAHARSDIAALRDAVTQCTALFDELGDRWGRSQASAWAGGLAELTGEYERAAVLHRDALRLAEELSLWPEVCGELCWLAWTAVQLGDQAQARDLAEQARRLGVEQDLPASTTFAELTLGVAARRDGKLDVAETELGRLLEQGRRDGPDRPALFLPMVLVELGFAAEQRGDPDAARTLHAEAFDIAHRMDWPRDATWALEGLAAATMAAGHHDTAARLLGAAAAARRSAALPAAPSDQAEIDRVAARVAAALGAAGFAAASADGEGMTPSQARSLVSPATR